jgi:hypothetical protein
MWTPPAVNRSKRSRSSHAGSLVCPEWPHILYERENDTEKVYM